MKINEKKQRAIWIVAEQNASFTNQYSVLIKYREILNRHGFLTQVFLGNKSELDYCKEKSINRLSDIPTCFQFYKPDLVIFYTFHKVISEMEFFYEKGVPIFNRPDSDGCVSLKHNAKQVLRKMLLPNKGIVQKAKAFKYWAQRWLFERDNQLNEIICNCEKSKVLAFPSPGCIDEFSKILIKEKRPDLIRKLSYVPYLVDPNFFEIRVIEKTKKIGVIANWLSDTGCNKNPHLIPKVFNHFFKLYPEYSLVIIGAGSNCLFGKWALNHSNVKIMEHIENSDLPNLMKEFQFLFFSSSHEGSPRVANEMLALGGTVVGGPLPGLIGLTSDGLYGSIARDFSAKALVEALIVEVIKWADGLREPNLISQYWREILSEDRFIAIINNTLNE